MAVGASPDAIRFLHYAVRASPNPHNNKWIECQRIIEKPTHTRFRETHYTQHFYPPSTDKDRVSPNIVRGGYSKRASKPLEIRRLESHFLK